MLRLFLSSYIFHHLISEVSGPIVTKLCHTFGADCNLGVPHPKNLASQRHQNFGVISENCEYLRIGTRYGRSENGVADCSHSRTCVPNLVNFRPQTAKNVTVVSTHSCQLFRMLISRVKGRCPLKISQMGRCVLMHASLWMGLPPTIL